MQVKEINITLSIGVLELQIFRVNRSEMWPRILHFFYSRSQLKEGLPACFENHYFMLVEAV